MCVQQYEIYFQSLHHIDIDSRKLQEKVIMIGDLDDYINNIIENYIKPHSDKMFDIRSETTEVISQIIKLLNDTNKVKFQEVAAIIAKRLIDKEIVTQEKFKHLVELKRGSLIQFLFKYDGRLTYLIAKIEHAAYLEAEELLKQFGLPYEDSILKTCIFTFNDDLDLEEVILTDSNTTPSRYWWEDFAELKELNTKEYNTKSAFRHIENTLSRNLKAVTPKDYYMLRNNLVGYFRTKNEFVYDDVLDYVFGDYQPLCDTTIIENVREKLTQLPENNKFDRKFEIAVEEIKARMVQKTFNVVENVVLQITGHVEDLEHTIQAYKDRDGHKYLRIKTDNDDTFRIFYEISEGGQDESSK
jgi:hypothetical protein